MRMIRYYGSSTEREESAVRTNENREVFTPPSFAERKQDWMQSDEPMQAKETVSIEEAGQGVEGIETAETTQSSFGEVSSADVEAAAVKGTESENGDFGSQRTEHVDVTERNPLEETSETAHWEDIQEEETEQVRLRLVNVANGYQPVEIYVNNQLFANYTGYGEATEYKNIRGGEIMVSLLGENGYIYLQRPVAVSAGKVITVAIINTGFGHGFVVVPERG